MASHRWPSVDIPGQIVSPGYDSGRLYEVKRSPMVDQSIRLTAATPVAASSAAAGNDGVNPTITTGGRVSRRSSILAPTTIEAYTKRPQTRPLCTCGTLLWFPFQLVLYVIAAMIVVFWLILSVMFGMVIFPVSPKWIIRFFRDLCNRPMSEGEKLAVEIELATISANDIKNTKLPTCPLRPHAFPHAIAHARFQVEEGLSNDLRVGVFSRVNAYDAIVRFSGDSTESFTKGLNGIAVKICGVPLNLGSSYMMWDQRAMRDEKDTGVTGARYDDNKIVDIDLFGDSAGTTFFSRNTREVLWNVVSLRGRYSILGYLPAWRTIWRTWVGQTRKNEFLQSGRGPLGWTYSSWTPHRLGGHIIKYYWLPDQIHPWRMPLRKVSSPCKKAIHDFLKESVASFGLYVQFQPLPTNPDYDKFPIEDASVEWDQKIAPLHRVATLTLPPQNIDTPERWHLGHTLSYNPWQTLYEHSPVGNINISRHRIYHAVAMERMKRLNYKSVPKCPFFNTSTSSQSHAVLSSTQLYHESEPYAKVSPTMSMDGYADMEAKTPKSVSTTGHATLQLLMPTSLTPSSSGSGNTDGATGTTPTATSASSSRSSQSTVSQSSLLSLSSNAPTAATVATPTCTATTTSVNGVTSSMVPSPASQGRSLTFSSSVTNNLTLATASTSATTPSVVSTTSISHPSGLSSSRLSVNTNNLSPAGVRSVTFAAQPLGQTPSPRNGVPPGSGVPPIINRSSLMVNPAPLAVSPLAAAAPPVVSGPPVHINNIRRVSPLTLPSLGTPLTVTSTHFKISAAPVASLPSSAARTAVVYLD